MLHFILGADGTGKSEYLRKLALEKAKTGEVLFTVPEQFSFSAEKYFYEKDGSQSISVVSFGKIEKKIFTALGGTALPFMNEGEKNIMMFRAVSECMDLLGPLAGTAHRPEAISKLCSFSDMLRSFSTTPEEFFKCASLSTPSAAEKAKDISYILDTFDALCEGKYYQESGILDAAVDKLRESHEDLFPQVVIFDEFWFYTGEQLTLIKEFLREGKEVYILLPVKSADAAGRYDTFSYPDKTKTELIQLAEDVKTGYDFFVLQTDMRHKARDLINLKETYLGNKSETKPAGDVIITECPDSFSEAMLTAARINELVMSGYSYKDFAVAVCDEAEYREVIEESFKKYGIPYFDDNLRPISENPLTAFAMTVMSLCSKGDAEMYMAAAKSGYIGLSEKEIECLENYVFIWGIKGSELEKPFTENPFGFDFKGRYPEEKINEELEKLNKIRQTVVMPVLKMRKALKNNPCGGEISKALYECLWKDYGIAKRLSEIVKDDPEAARTTGTVFNAFSEMLDKLYNMLETTPLTVKNYRDLLYLYASSVKTGNVPMFRDTVSVGTPDRMRNDGDIKVLFVMGACDGMFPGGHFGSDIFSKKEKNDLKENGLGFIKCEEDVYAENLFTVYKTLLRPSEKLYISYPVSLLSGAETAKSEVIPEIDGRIGVKIEKYDDIDRTLFIKSPDGAFSEMARTFTENTGYSAALKQYFSENGRKDLVDRLSAGKLIAEDKVKDKELLRRLYPDVISLSASKADVFFQCRFRYFCSYVLRLEPRREARLAPAESGTLIHYILEKIIDMLSRGETDKDRIKDDIEALFCQCMERFFGAADTKSMRFLRAYDKLKRTVKRLGERLAEELAESEFTPCDFELDIGSGESNEPLTFTTPGGKEVVLRGSIDRVDILHKNGEDYIRVIDYKSGKKEFKLSEIQDGINMQMLIYLMALQNGGKGKYKNVYPAGVLYVPAKDPGMPDGRNLTDEKISEKVQSDTRMNGILLNNEQVLKAMEKNLKGKYIPIKTGKNGEIKIDNLATLSQFGKIQRKITDNLNEMTEALTNGDPLINPIDTAVFGTIKACMYCDYKSVCGNFDGDNLRPHTEKGTAEYLADLEEEYGLDE